RDGGLGIVISDGQRLAAGGGTAVENAGLFAESIGVDKGCDELRGFVLNDDLAGAESLGVRDVAGLNATGRSEKSAGADGDSFLLEMLFRRGRAETDRSRGNGLIVLADLAGGGESIGVNPALDHPERVRKAAGQGFGRRGIVRGSIVGVRGGRELAQDGVHEGSGGAPAGAFHQFDTLVERGALRDAVEPEELVDGEAEGDENLNIQFGEWLRGRGGDLGVETRAPAED